MPSESAATVGVVIEDIADEYGLWCDQCALPGVFDSTVAAVIDGKVEFLARQRECVDCGHVYVDSAS